jgi:CheY-like chemotaxis protein
VTVRTAGSTPSTNAASTPPAGRGGPARPASPGRSQLDLLAAQVRGIDAWNRSNRLSQEAAEVIGLTREMRLDLSHRMETRRREHAALVARVDEQLRASGQLLTERGPVRVVVAHRNAWLVGKVTSRLEQLGVVIVGAYADGADAAGTIVAEQPELVFLEDRLPSLAGSDLVRRVRDFSPTTVIGAQVEDSRGIAPLVDIGAHAVFTRRIPPVEMADQLLACLTEQRTVTLL